MKFSFLRAPFCALLLLSAVCVSAAEPVLPETVSAADALEACRAALPDKPVELKGAIVLRNRRGIVQRSFSYVLLMDRSRTPATVAVDLFEHDTTNVLDRITLELPGKAPAGFVGGTDIRWTDLALDCFWWKDARWEAVREGETVHGQKCDVLRVVPPVPVEGVAAMRIWVDRKNGCAMQAEEIDADGKAVRRLWGARVKKFGDRWMANVLEVEVLGSGHRTKITVDELTEK